MTTSQKAVIESSVVTSAPTLEKLRQEDLKFSQTLGSLKKGVPIGIAQL